MARTSPKLRLEIGVKAFRLPHPNLNLTASFRTPACTSNGQVAAVAINFGLANFTEAMDLTFKAVFLLVLILTPAALLSGWPEADRRKTGSRLASAWKRICLNATTWFHHRPHGKPHAGHR